MAPSGSKMALAQTWDQFWLHSGSILGLFREPQKHSKMKLNLNTISDAVLTPILDPFSIQHWTNLRVLWDMC